MTEDELKFMASLIMERLVISIVQFKKLELESIDFTDEGFEESERWLMLQEMLVGRKEESFEMFRKQLLNDPEAKAAEARIRRWLNDQVKRRRESARIKAA